MIIIRLALDLVAWLSLGSLCLILFLLARYYQRRAGHRTYYQVFLIMAPLIPGAGIWDALSSARVEASAPALILALAGLGLIVTAGHLFGLMLGSAR